MATPKTQQIRDKAIEMFNERNQHLPYTSPTNSELKENGLYFEARNSLMTNTAKQETLSYLEEMAHSINYRVIPSSEFEGIETETFHGLKFDMTEAQKSNILVSGANRSGKTLLSCSIASVLMRYGWRVVCFDGSSVWKNVSDIPFYYEVKPNEYYFKIPTINKSIIYDTSALIPEQQRFFIDGILRNLWNNRGTQHYIWNMVILEEAQLFMKNFRGSLSQNLFRLASVGRNKQVRLMAICFDLALIDSAFIRLSSQRFHGKINIESNCRRKFKAYYGKRWLDVAENLTTGSFIYVNDNNLQKIKTPLFTATRKPQDINELSKPKAEIGLLEKLVRSVFK